MAAADALLESVAVVDALAPNDGLAVSGGEALTDHDTEALAVPLPVILAFMLADGDALSVTLAVPDADAFAVPLHDAEALMLSEAFDDSDGVEEGGSEGVGDEDGPGVGTVNAIRCALATLASEFTCGPMKLPPTRMVALSPGMAARARTA